MSDVQPQHRGRIQMQGGSINESLSWARNTPLLAEEGLTMLSTLEENLPWQERMIRAKAIAAAKAFISRCETAGGIHAQISRSFNVSGDRNRRVDIEVHSGVAFAPANTQGISR